MSPVAVGIPLDLLLALQLFHPFLLLCQLLRSVPFLGLTALAQCYCTICQTLAINPRCGLAQTCMEWRRRYTTTTHAAPKAAPAGRARGLPGTG